MLKLKTILAALALSAISISAHADSNDVYLRIATKFDLTKPSENLVGNLDFNGHINGQLIKSCDGASEKIRRAAQTIYELYLANVISKEETHFVNGRLYLSVAEAKTCASLDEKLTYDAESLEKMIANRMSSTIW